MILDNFINAFVGNFYYARPSGVDKFVTTQGVVRDMTAGGSGTPESYGFSGSSLSGQTFQYVGDNFSNGTTYAGNVRYFSLSFGSGTTAVTRQDHCMEVPLGTTSHFTWKSFTKSTSKGTGLQKIIYVATIQNKSEIESLTISEVGLVGQYDSGTSYATVQLTRDVLETPITLLPNEVKTIQYSLNLGEMATSIVTPTTV